MPKIGKIRFVNFTYNDNRHIYDQTFDFYNGEDTLLNLQNGGGKTVLVQMMMQPVIPKVKLKDRLFKSYFMNAKAPVYIMIEWILDGRPERVLTGIGVKRALGKNIEDEAGSLRVVTFLSEYETGSPYDLKNIALTYEEKGIVKLIDFDKVVKNFSNAQKEGQDISVFRWNTPEDKREYARKLAEYKINQAEWKNLMVRINEAEAGLNSFFNDCKTNKALIKKWFIPTIEDQLNRNGNLIENIKELIRNHARQLVKNQDMIAEREIFEDFKRKSTTIIASLEEYSDLIQVSDENELALGNACAFTLDSMKKLELEKEEAANQMKAIGESIKALDYQRLSSEYYVVADSLQQLKENLFGISEKIEVKKIELDQLEAKKHMQLYMKLKDEIINLNTRIATFESELEKETLKQEDRKSVINDIKYSLKEKYQEKICKLESALQDEKIRMTEEKNKLEGYQEELKKANKEILVLNDRFIQISGGISAFREGELSLKSRYEDFKPDKNMDSGEYSQDSLDELEERLDTEEKRIRQSIWEIEEKRQESEERLLFLEKESRELRDASPALAIEKNQKESACQIFQKEKQEIEKILQTYQIMEGEQITETWLSQKEKLLVPLYAEKEKYQKLMNDLNLENSVYEKHLKQYESGKAFEISDDIKGILDEHNIFVEFGHDWLRNLQKHKREKQRIVKNNPFLPYAIIAAKKDFELIKELEFKGILSPVIPIVEREKLEQIASNQVGKDIYALEGMHFLIPFDDRVLNKNYVKEICDEISAKVRKNDAVMDHAQEALRNMTADILKIENFPYTKEDAKKLQEEMDLVTEQWKECSRKLGDVEKEILQRKEADKKDLLLQNSLEKEKERFSRKKEDILGFIKKCGQYSLDLKEKRQIEEALKKASQHLTESENGIAKAQKEIDDCDRKSSNISSSLEKETLQYEKYADTPPGKLLEDNIENLESKLAVYTSETKGKIQNLQDILADYKRSREEKQKERKGYGISEDEVIGKEYHAFEYEEICEQLVENKCKYNKIVEEKNEIRFQIAERKSDLKYKRDKIEEHCGYLEPLQRELIKDIPFQKEKQQKEASLKEIEKEISLRKKQENKLQKIWFALEEYRGFADKVTKRKPIEGYLGEYVLELIKAYKNNIVLLSDYKNTIAAHYNSLESEFVPKAEIFKSLFHSILQEEKRYQPAHGLNAFQRVLKQIDRRLEQHAIDIQKIDDMENYIIDNTLSYLKNVYDEMAHIDQNSTIDLEGRRCKMLIIRLPDMESLESISLKEYIKSTILNCVELCKIEKSMDGLLDSEISTYNLFDRYVSVNKVEITLIKIEPNKLKKKTWRQVIAENSGGELFVSAFVVFISLLTYMRGDNMMNTNMDGKVLIMDNPFGPITSEHLLKPLFEISKKYNTQLICLTDVKGHAIYDRFNLIYTLNIEREVGREEEYIEIKTVKKDIQTEGDEIVSASMFKIEDKSRFELMN